MMKIKANIQGNGDGDVEETLVIPFEGQSEDDLRALIRFTPAPSAAPAANVDTALKLRLQHETTRKGVLRLMVALSIPYSAFYAADTGTGEPNLKFNAARSGGDITVHTVITLPKEFVADVAQQKAGSAGVEGAFGHLQALLAVFRSLAFTSGLRCLNGGTSFTGKSSTLEPSGLEVSSADGILSVKPLGNIPADWTYESFRTLIGRVLSGMSAVEDDAEIGLHELEP